MSEPTITFKSGFSAPLEGLIRTKGSISSPDDDNFLPICIFEGTYDDRDKGGKSVIKSSLLYLPSSSDGKPIGSQAIMPNEFLNGTTTQPYCVGLSGISSLVDPDNQAFKKLCCAFKARCLSVPDGDENYLLAQQILAKMASDAEAKAKRLREEQLAREMKALDKKTRSLEITKQKKAEADTRRVEANE
jgi:hypothetical protein